ncbi:DUF4133 domain-containing protein [Mucilaginibacter sp. McL0603]|uniref:DUF4133 domain-containing protein n=1 Tax=Mucilaginibacter sp. McL0603 TaxID=3415670 RepID=UPI003CF4C8EA
MQNSIYIINKGINKSIEFRGLCGQYIWYFGGLVIGLMILFAALYIAGAGTILCLGLTGALGAFSGIKIFALSRRYGEHGLMKTMAKRQVPKVLKSYSRKFFQNLEKEDTHEQA